ncbi:MAG TPA: hypothetical protein PKL73_25195 [Polyangiaceae bacterium]|nr:hypothetical protein [Polyangiaceae bacterium]HNZ25520.1 hypothetical protein [Polyangiaceae bacterium]HOD25599.1 hypothetical protein [Polyangiaceae bacterium]HOE51849.1 hypothetical protein [Polyangiaceae bacterium]HOH03770.1 hypothetical protein [Polyangiaceae bacterium]
MTRIDYWKAAFVTGCSVLAFVAVHLGHTDDADAAKIRKKPPLQPLASRSAPSPATSVPPSTPGASAPAPTVDPTPAIPYPTSGLVCLYGEQRDPESQKIRCLAPEELSPPRLVYTDTRALAEQLGMYNPATTPPPAGITEGPEGPEPENPKARVVTVSFENGVVGGALKNLRSHTDEFASCLDQHGGLRVPSARLKLMFFVRSNQKPSEMIVASARNVPTPIVRCVRKVIESNAIGRPSTDAVGVTVLIELKNPGS